MRYSYPLIALSSLLFVSCAQKWDASQKAALSTVAVPSPVMKEGAYQKPAGKMPTGSAPVVVVPGAGFAAGAVGNGLGQLVVEGIGGVQQSMYEKANKDAISRVSGTVPNDIPQRLRKAVAHELDTNSFFRGRVRELSPNRLVINVESYGYVRSAKVEGKILMTPQMTGTFELFDGSGKSLLKQRSIGFATSSARPLEDFANDRKLASKAFDEAIGNFAMQVSASVDLKAGPAKN